MRKWKLGMTVMASVILASVASATEVIGQLRGRIVMLEKRVNGEISATWNGRAVQVKKMSGAGLTQQQVADLVDCTQSAVSQRESGEKTPREAIQEWILQLIQEHADSTEEGHRDA